MAIIEGTTTLHEEYALGIGSVDSMKDAVKIVASEEPDSD